MACAEAPDNLVRVKMHPQDVVLMQVVKDGDPLYDGVSSDTAVRMFGEAR